MAETTAQKAQSKLANVRYGLYGQPGPYAGKSITDIRKEVGGLWGIPADAAAFKGKERLDDSYVVESGDQIEFHRKMGEKG